MGNKIKLYQFNKKWENFANFLMFIPIMIGLMYALPGFGPLKRPVLIALAFAPVIILGSYLGLKISSKMSSKTLYKLTCIFLLITGTSAIVSSLLAFQK